MKYFVLILICAAINSLDDSNKDYRKLYGISFHKNCGNYIITFKCMTACKSMRYQVFRLDYKCKCSCHELKTTTFLPQFVWRTNGTTREVPKTASPSLYAVVGTLSPIPSESDEELITTGGSDATNVTLPPTCAPGNSTDKPMSNTTVSVPGSSTTSNSTTDTATSETPAPEPSEVTTVASLS